jgi:hypothetical protein
MAERVLRRSAECLSPMDWWDMGCESLMVGFADLERSQAEPVLGGFLTVCLSLSALASVLKLKITEGSTVAVE